MVYPNFKEASTYSQVFKPTYPQFNSDCCAICHYPIIHQIIQIIGALSEHLRENLRSSELNDNSASEPNLQYHLLSLHFWPTSPPSTEHYTCQYNFDDGDEEDPERKDQVTDGAYQITSGIVSLLSVT